MSTNDAAPSHEPGAEELIRGWDRHLTARQRAWIEAPGLGRSSLRRLAYRANRWLMRTLLGVERVGSVEPLPDRPVIFAPNHASTLDSPVLASVLDWQRFARTRFAVRRGVVSGGAWRRCPARTAGVVPIRRDLSALAVAAAVLARGDDLVWYPEGTRTRDGRLGPFKPGIGLLLEHCDAVALPVHLDGVFASMPPGRLWPRRVPIRVRFGPPVAREMFATGGADTPDRVDAMVEEVRLRVLALEAEATEEGRGR